MGHSLGKVPGPVGQGHSGGYRGRHLCPHHPLVPYLPLVHGRRENETVCACASRSGQCGCRAGRWPGQRAGARQLRAEHLLFLGLQAWDPGGQPSPAGSPLAGGRDLCWSASQMMTAGSQCLEPGSGSHPQLRVT